MCDAHLFFSRTGRGVFYAPLPVPSSGQTPATEFEIADFRFGAPGAGLPNEGRSGSAAGGARASRSCYRDDRRPLRDRDAALRVPVDRADALLAVDLRAVDFFAVDLRAVDFLAVDFLAVDLRAVDLRAVDLRAVDFLAVRFFVAFLAPEDAFLAGLTSAAFRQRRALRVAPA